MDAFRDSLFRSLADPTRRAIFENLCRKGERTVGALTADAGISQPSVSKHLAILKEAGLVTEEQDGTRRIYRIDPHGLARVRAWLDQFWEIALDAFKAQAEQSDDEGNNK